MTYYYERYVDYVSIRVEEPDPEGDGDGEPETIINIHELAPGMWTYSMTEIEIKR